MFQIPTSVFHPLFKGIVPIVFVTDVLLAEVCIATWGIAERPILNSRHHPTTPVNMVTEVAEVPF